ncbi:MAG: cytochrome b [Gammaproteobacteria bacterium]|nr:cytochrome b [Gammaproteobacteria bacterium]
MSIRNTPAHWGLAARALHWLMAFMIAAQVPLGFWMVDAYDAWLAGSGDGDLVMTLSRIHNTMGFLLLILVAARLVWRLQNPTPDLPAGLAAWQRMTARVTHGLLYGLLVVFPLTGWAALSAYDGEFPIFFFGWDNVFRIVPQATEGSPFTSDLFGEIHETCWKIGTVVLGLHVIGAVWHEHVRRDGVLTRMWRG